MQDSASFWTDIKNLEEQLANSPDSFCFARLSDVYLKVGLVDDALHVARQGVLKHPGYLSGQRALALACHAKGLSDEARTALHLVVGALPEDVPSQKLLGRLSADAGDPEAAIHAFRTALEFAPDDAECRTELEYLERPDRETAPDEDDEEIIEDLEILDEIDIFEEDQPESDLSFPATSPEPDIVAASHHDPLSTGTLAELYVTQGFINKALEIYRSILADNPADRVTAERIVELERQAAGPAEAEPEIDETFEVEAEEDGEGESVFSMPSEEFYTEPEPAALRESVVFAEGNQHTGNDVFRHESGVPVVTPRGVTDKTVATLEGWLETIRRIKSCR